MSRSLLITIHLYLSSFFAVIVLLVAISGGLYLAGYKGTVAETEIAVLRGQASAFPAAASPADVHALLDAAGVKDFDFEYLRLGGDGKQAVTRPTSSTHYRIDARGPDVVITRGEPSLQARLMELHKGHGPGYFKIFQQVFAAGMLFIILSGLWLGLSSPRLRRNTGTAAASGLLVFLLLIFI